MNVRLSQPCIPLSLPAVFLTWRDPLGHLRIRPSVIHTHEVAGVSPADRATVIQRTLGPEPSQTGLRFAGHTQTPKPEL